LNESFSTLILLKPVSKWQGPYYYFRGFGIEPHSPVIITRQNSNAVVMMSLEDYNAIEETAYLLRSPPNAERLRESIKQATEEGKVFHHDLIEKHSKQKETT